MVDSPYLQRLVDERRYDELLGEVTLADIAAAWVRYQRSAPKVDEPWDHDPDWWAAQLWMDNSGRDAWWTDEARVRAGILALVAAADEVDAGVIGAAIMAMFIADDEDRLAWLEEQARRSDLFRRSLANVYVWGQEPDDVARRVKRAAGVDLPRPRPGFPGSRPAPAAGA